MRCNIDSRSRLVDMLRVSVTDRCNLRCLYCMPQGGVSLFGHEEMLTFEEIKRFVEAAAELGINKIKLTGGEPLVRHGVVGLVEELSSIAGVAEISMTTNGIMLKSFASALRKAGLKRINISLDTLRGDRFAEVTRGGRLEDALDGIRASLAAGYDAVKINVVAMKGINDDEIADFVMLTKEMPLTVRFIELMPRFSKLADYKERFLPISQVLGECKKAGELIVLDGKFGSGPAKYARIEGFKGSLGFISPITHPFCNTCNRLRLTADGALKSCLFSNGLDVQSALRRNASREEIQELIARALSTKPAGHNLSASDTAACDTAMSQIGG